MIKTFFYKYYPNHKTQNIKKQISTFAQKAGETLHQAWERYKDLLNLCPHHGYESWRVVSFFYDGVSYEDLKFIEMMCSGGFLKKNPEEAFEFLEEAAEKSHQWRGPNPTESTSRNPTPGIYQLKEEDSINVKLALITRKLEALEAKESKAIKPVANVEAQACPSCGGVDHVPSECPMLICEVEQGKAIGFPSRFSNTYNQQWQNHHNLSWRNNQSSQSNDQWRPSAQPSTSFAPQPSAPQPRNPLEDQIQALVELQKKNTEDIQELKSGMGRINSTLSELVKEKGRLPSQTQPNPCPQNTKGMNAITTRSGKVVDRPSPSTNQTIRIDDEEGDREEVEPPLPVHFPHVLNTPKPSKDHSEIIEQLKQVKVNLPLLHVIKKIPTYAKVIKDLCTLKRKHKVSKKTFLAEQVSAVIERKTPPKFKDPGCPTVTCRIGKNGSSEALLDLGASVNLMPYSIYLQLGLGELKPTHVELQLADRSIRKPRGIIEDVLVQIDKFYYPVDFIVIETQSRVDLDSKVPIILGRPFLATANANINCRNDLMNLTFGNMTLEVNIFHVGGTPQVEEVSNCEVPTLVDTLEKEEEFEQLHEKSFDSFSIVDSYIDCTYHHAGNVFSSCDDV
ncbi:hypothetical protein UlMin_023249 [Ulmus minor]